MKFQVGDIIKIKGEDDYGFVVKEDCDHFWIYWFNGTHIDCNPKESLYKYNKTKDCVMFMFMKVS